MYSAVEKKFARDESKTLVISWLHVIKNQPRCLDSNEGTERGGPQTKLSSHNRCGCYSWCYSYVLGQDYLLLCLKNQHPWINS